MVLVADTVSPMTDTTGNREALRSARQGNAAERRRLKEQRKRARERMVANEQKRRDAESTLDHNAIVTGLVPRINGAIDSWAGKRVPLHVEHPADSFHALTDFQAIWITIPAQEVNIDFVADLRGLAYHEAGHILKSIPYPTLLETVMPVADDAVAEQSRQGWINTTFGVNESNLHRAWNMLEDQRMESAMVIDSNNLARYYNVIVLTHVVQEMNPLSYLLLHGRKHVTPAVRRAARAVMAEVWGQDIVDQVSYLVDTYKATDDVGVMWECVVKFCLLLQYLGDSQDSFDGHGDPGEGAGRRPMTPDEARERARESQSEAEGDEEGAEEAGDGEPCDQGDSGGPKGSRPTEGADGTDKAEGEGDESDDEGDSQEGQGGVGDRSHGVIEQAGGDIGASGSINKPWDRKTVEEALQEAKEARNQDGQIVRDIKAFNEARQQAAKNIPLERVVTSRNPDPVVTQTAHGLNRQLRNLMEQARAETAPSWQTQQRSGVLDVKAYKTRQPGDMEFFRAYAEGGDMHLPNMAVSILLDGSGSMYRSNAALAAAAFGMKSACDVFGIPCTVTIYDTDAFLLWDADDRPLDVPLDVVPGGGTDPKAALDVLDLQKHDKANHLVIIMTDGSWSVEWQNQYSLAHYAMPDRDLVLFFYGAHSGHARGPQGMEACSTVEKIDNLSEMPRFLQRYIVRAM